jgi:hypothetical protein
MGEMEGDQEQIPSRGPHVSAGKAHSEHPQSGLLDDATLLDGLFDLAAGPR